MEPRPLGRSGRLVAPVAFGAWAIGGSGWGPPGDEKERHAAVERAVDLGFTVFDTAPTYGGGRSEEILGNVLTPVREQVLIATKCGPNDDPIESLEGSLRRLRTGYVDLYQLHEVPETDTAFGSSLERMAMLLEEGTVRALGLCNVDVRQLRRALGIAPILAVQNPYNLFDRDIEPRLLGFCHDQEIGVLAYRPLASGLLTGKYAAPPEFGSDDHRSRIYWFRGKEFRLRTEVVRKLEGVARERDVTVAQLALAWVLARPGVTAVLAGARTPEQVSDNIEAADIDLSAEEVATIDAWVAEAFTPPRLQPDVVIEEPSGPDGDVPVTDRRTGRTLSLGAREAFILRHLDGRTPYEEIAEAWNERSTQTLISAQVKVFAEQLEALNLVSFGEK